MLEPYTSRVLYHLTGRGKPSAHDANLDTLRAILRTMEIRTCRVGRHIGGATTSIDLKRGLVDGEPIAQTVTCFCDIPFCSLSLHTSKYGRFGVGIDRRIAGSWGARPVIYVPIVSDNNPGLNNYLCSEALSIWQGLDAHFPEPAATSRIVGAPPKDAIESTHMAKHFIANVLAFVKTFDIALSEDDPNNYYMEREWRKFANMPLHSVLREIIAPTEYHDMLRSEFPHLAAVPFKAVG